jgi:flagellar hook-basal body complex protein FliE
MINPISSILPIALPGSMTLPGAAGPQGSFQQALDGAINTMESLHNDETQSARRFLTGDNEELHTTVLATQRAELAFELGLQVRNKVVSAYQEIMKMQL